MGVKGLDDGMRIEGRTNVSSSDEEVTLGLQNLDKYPLCFSLCTMYGVIVDRDGKRNESGQARPGTREKEGPRVM